MSAQPGESPTEDQDLLEANLRALKTQDSRLVSEYKAGLLETGAAKYWDLFYKRNETRFFRDRHWTTREFAELLGDDNSHGDTKRVLFEVGCGVGNFIYPLVEESLNLQIFSCDLSPRAVELAKANPLHDPLKMTIFQCDITSEEVLTTIRAESVDIITLIFVLSAIHPDKFPSTLTLLYKLLKPGGLILFRDYGMFDMAQMRFKPGSKIAENFYMRQDGTRSYFFSLEATKKLFEEAGFKLMVNCYVHRRTVNKKEALDVGRIFVQVKAQK